MESQLERIDKYLLGLMSDEDKNTFEAQVKQDAILAMALKKQQLAMVVLEAAKDSELKSRLNKIHDDLITRPRKVVSLWPDRRKALWIGVSAIILVLVALFIFNQEDTPQQLFTANFEKYELSFVARGQEASVDLVNAGEKYQLNNYAQALEAFNDLSASETSSAVNLAIAICQLKLQRLELAKTQLENLLDDPMYDEPAHWYYALAYLAGGDKEMAKQQLKLIPDRSEFHEKAIILLSVLD